MSLLFEHAVDRFSLEDASLVAADGADLADGGDSVPVRPIAEFAGDHDSLTHPEEGWTCIPLHERDGAAPTDEFVAYTDHEVRGRLFLIERDGDLEPVPADEFGDARLADRIRFWHSDYLPETRPPGYDAPIDDHEEPRNPVDADRLLDEFAAYVADERAATRAANRERARSRSARAVYDQGGSAIPSVTCLGEDDGAYRFRVDLDPELEDRRDGDWAYFVESEFGIYQGNEVLLQADTGDAPDAFPVAAAVEKIRGLTLWLTVDWGAVDDSAAAGASLAPDREFGVSELLNPVPFDRERDAVEALRERSLGGVLAGERPVSFSNGAAARSDPFDADLNQEQQLAVEYALLADDLFCVHGPPGTGKTRTLLEIVRRAVDAGEDVLVCADSNQALDNLVAGASTPGDPDPGSLHAHGQHGSGEFTLDRANAKRSARAVVREGYRDVADRADVVAATNSSAAALAREFDLLVLDEATQSTCTASCIPLSRADRVVLAGDHRQLPPFSATEEPPESSYGLSLFEHLYAEGGVYEGVGLQLKTQYRMHRDVAHFPNREFYDRTLRNGRAVDPLPDRPPVEGYSVGGPVEVVDHSRRNETEARLVVHLVRQLLDEVPPDEIGVITPYAAQARLLRDRLADHVDRAAAVAADTVDAFQGSEKTAVVISLVRSNADGDLGFLGRPEDGPRRLNVALTRAKRYCAVVGDFHTLRYENEAKCGDLYRSFHDYLETTGRLNDVDPQFIPV
ncbi:AAA domain-containing protein [Halomicrobium salinisoli]|uniref:AAA domain-containing protein n=1 Tax=Halomicrobium salinisoli TaxID=2878391 RepID=UPI001CF01AFB|nr:AAA domain-containing protein [Halomicrobium salinisoli]